MAMGPVRRLVAALGAAALVGGCGAQSDSGTTSAPAQPRATVSAQPTPVVAAHHGPIPPALRTAESAAEDTIDLALAGRRARVVAKADRLRAVADGPAGPALRAAGVSEAEIAAFRAQAREVARLAPTADLVRVALASNRAFGFIAEFFAHYDSRIPAQVSTLDHLDFEAKLRATAGDRAALGTAASGLDRTWTGLRPGVVHAGGARVARRFDAHVARLQRLAATGGRPAAREAQRGLDLVDEIEDVYRR
jgi:surface antigen